MKPTSLLLGIFAVSVVGCLTNQAVTDVANPAKKDSEGSSYCFVGMD